MEKESGISKPGDLFIGVVDFFAVLVPGVIAASLIVEAMGGDLEHAGKMVVAGVVTAGWVLWHVLHGIGSGLDFLLYDRLFKPSDRRADAESQQRDSNDPEVTRKGVFNKLRRLRAGLREYFYTREYFHKNDLLHRLATEITDYPDKHKQTGQAASTGVPGGMYQWARAWLNSHSPESTSNLDRHEADSKLFRSLAVLFLIAVLVLIAGPFVFLPPAVVSATSHGRTTIEIPNWWRLVACHRSALIILAFAGVLFSLWRYCDLRNKMIRQCYLNYVQLRFESRHDSEPPAAAT
jgi:hypothetical protein